MSHKHATTLGLALAILGIVSTLGFVPVTLAQGAGDSPVSRGVVATVATINANTAMATLRTEDGGEVFEHPQESSWHVGHKVICDRTGRAPRARFLNCRIWESTHSDTRPSQVERPSRR